MSEPEITPPPHDPRNAPQGQQRRSGAGLSGRRGGVWGELALALPPTLVVLVSGLLLESFRHQRLLFASLASSAFLIYRAPDHAMNTTRVMVTAHLVGVALGVGAALALGAGYRAGAVAMAGTIIALVLLNAVHPPAISTALGFAFFPQQDQAAGFFVLALVMLAALVVLQRTATWIVRRFATQLGADR